MKTNLFKMTPCLIALLAAGGLPALAQNSDLDQLKASMQTMQKTMEDMQKKIAELEREKAQLAGSTNLIESSPSFQTIQRIAVGEDVGHASPIVDRGALRNEQEGAPRPK